MLLFFRRLLVTEHLSW